MSRTKEGVRFLGRPLSFLSSGREHVFLIMVPYRENQAYSEHISHERTSAVADERERNTRDWQQANGHPDILKYVEGDHADDTDTDVSIEIVFRFHADFCDLINQQEKQAYDDTCTDEAELLADDAEYEVSMTLGQVHFPCSIALPHCFT